MYSIYNKRGKYKTHNLLSSPLFLIICSQSNYILFPIPLRAATMGYGPAPYYAFHILFSGLIIPSHFVSTPCLSLLLFLFLMSTDIAFGSPHSSTKAQAIKMKMSSSKLSLRPFVVALAFFLLTGTSDAVGFRKFSLPREEDAGKAIKSVSI